LTGQTANTNATQADSSIGSVVSKPGDVPESDASSSSNDSTNPSALTPGARTVDYAPMTFSEHARKYILGAVGPGAILRAAAAGGIAQFKETPKEWKTGPEAYGERFGNVYAQHVIREALEFGGSLALHEDNRYFRSTETGFFARTKHAVISAFVTRNPAGREQFAYSRFGGVLGASFISRIWQPRSTDSAGDALTSFGLTMVSDIGWNFFHEFRPRSLARHSKVN
jgi:hypothetical protein